MNNEDFERQVEFILEQQAKFAASFGEQQVRDAANLAKQQVRDPEVNARLDRSIDR